jgi:hypothetical protein
VFTAHPGDKSVEYLVAFWERIDTRLALSH